MALLRRLCRCKRIFPEVFGMSGGSISTASGLCEKALESLKENPFFDKYADKIASLEKESPEELRSRIEEHEKSKQKRRERIQTSSERPYSVASEKGKPLLERSPHTRTKKLDDVMKTELLREKTAEEIERIWLDYHRNKDVVVSVVPKDTYAAMSERGEEFPTFLLPVPRSQGYEFIVCQFAGNEVHFTPLIAYQTHKENAPECLTLTFYADLLGDKEIVLMKGEYDTDILNCQEAQCLVNELQLYYAQNNSRRINLLKRFTHTPSKFNHMDLIAELETLSL